MKKLTLAAALCVAVAIIAGCTSATGQKTVTINGVTTTESIKVKSFFSTITDGKWSSTNGNGEGVTLSTTAATPDQQSLSIAVGGIVELAKAVMVFAAKAPTNAPPVVTTNSPAK